jgi:hypothetical protein
MFPCWLSPARLIPAEVLLGYHLRYGTFPEWPMYEARDLGLLVYCGFGRQPGTDGTQTMREHARVVRARRE